MKIENVIFWIEAVALANVRPSSVLKIGNYFEGGNLCF
jgi:hypothetical protein